MKIIADKINLKNKIMITNKIVAVDIDGVLTVNKELNDYGKISFDELKKLYYAAKPNPFMIKEVNRLAKTNKIIIFTSRNDYFFDLTVKWLEKYKVKYHQIIFNKPYYHYIIDDRALFV